jgi:hypothetical protein
MWSDVIKRASRVIPDTRSRASYRNLFYPHKPWVFTGNRMTRATGGTITAGSQSNFYRTLML